MIAWQLTIRQDAFLAVLQFDLIASSSYHLPIAQCPLSKCFLAVLQFLLAKVHQNDVWNHRFDDLCIMMMIMIAMMVTFMSLITSLALYDDDENNIGKDNNGDDGEDYGDVTGHQVGASRAPEGCMALMIFALHLITRTVSSPLPETINITQICY